MPEKQQQDPFEEQLAAALRDTGGAFRAADRTTLIDAGRTRGRRALTRRRTGVLGGVAGVALIGVGGAMLLPSGDSSNAEQSSAATRTTAQASSSAAPPPVSGDAILKSLKELLPEGEYGASDARGTGEQPGPYAQVVFDDGRGEAAISLGFGRVEPGSPEVGQLTRCPDDTFVPYDSCDSSRLDDGSTLRLMRGYEYPDRRVDTKLWSADLVTAEGQHVSVSEWNSAAEKGAPITREDPPLSTDELKKLVTADVWRDVVAATPVRPTPSASAGASEEERPPAVSGGDITKTLVGLLPEGLKVVKKGGQETEFSYVVVDDGRGASMVQVNVQHGMDDVAGQLYGSGETLPDGTLIATRQGVGDDRVPGVLMWTVDTMRPGTDGFRVVISEFNNGSAHGRPTRDAPALTMDQLREIALSEEWDALR
ncbi:hypothetical protein G3I32_01980 [Streptomyces coelicoflavus]|uniref:Uncharacterized protein n=1 Tax=Streptomyces coelicoflavus TaxID=285562 RepID=A0A7K3PCD0_9ACTN|nr:hypothetical protein [Streptomyces coelicoflavus]NEB07666.1 hypothetical protein [Streptomyces coelicoflavus]